MSDLKQKILYSQLIIELFSGLYTPEEYKKLHDLYRSDALTEKIAAEQFNKIKDQFQPLNDLEVTNNSLKDIFDRTNKYGNFQVTFAELLNIIELPKNKKLFAKDLPLHARIGFGRLLGGNITEEYNLLEDAIFHYKLSHFYLEEFNTLVTDIKKSSYEDPKFAEFYRMQRVNIICHSRTTIQLFFQFLESFVNSVAFNYLRLQEDTLNKENMEILNNKQMDLLDRIQSVIKIINPNHKLEEYKEMFDIYPKIVSNVYKPIIEYNEKTKSVLMINDEGWMKNMIAVYGLVKGVSMIFWQECYPDQGLPEYLNFLNFDRIESAMEYRMPDEQNRRFIHVKQNHKKDKKKQKRKRK